MTKTDITDDLTVAWMAGYHKRDAEIEQLRGEAERRSRVEDERSRRAVEMEKEIERLREELNHCLHLGNHNAIVRSLQEAAVVVTAEKDDEIERLREENALLTKGWQPATPTALLAEIERLRALLRDLLEEDSLSTPWHMRVREALGDA